MKTLLWIVGGLFVIGVFAAPPSDPHQVARDQGSARYERNVHMQNSRDANADFRQSMRELTRR